MLCAADTLEEQTGGAGAVFLKNLQRDWKRNKYIYLMAIPVILFYAVFCYMPMAGIVIAFQDFEPAKGVWGSDFVFLDNFIAFFTDYQFPRILKNTLLLSGGLILFGFPVPIILALLINELHWKKYKRVIQTVSYLPHFISLVVICSLITEFTNSDGVINQVLAMFGVEPTTWLMRPELFKPLFIVSDIWQHAGWSSIVYLAALSAIDPGLYEAATIDGAGRFKQLLHVTLPALIPTITILFIMRIGNVMSLGYEKVILLYNSNTMETADVIASFAYRKGILDMDYGFSTAVGLFNSVVNFGFLWLANTFSKKMTENSLW